MTLLVYPQLFNGSTVFLYVCMLPLDKHWESSEFSEGWEIEVHIDALESARHCVYKNPINDWTEEEDFCVVIKNSKANCTLDVSTKVLNSSTASKFKGI